jgi:hypothetical protein
MRPNAKDAEAIRDAGISIQSVPRWLPEGGKSRSRDENRHLLPIQKSCSA